MVKNLKTYLAAYATTMAVLLTTGCSENNNSKRIKREENNSITTESEYIDDQIYLDSDSIEDKEITDDSSTKEYSPEDFNPFVEVNFTEKENNLLKTGVTYDTDMEETINTISSIDNKYEYEEYYLLDEALEKYKNLQKVNISNTKNIIENGKINRDAFLNSIYQNSDSNISKELIDKIATIIADDIDYMLNHYDLDIDSIEHSLEALKIDNQTSFSYGAYTPNTNSMHINENAIKVLADQHNMSEEEVLHRIIEHETNHLLQNPIQDYLAQNNCELANGICTKFKDSKVNSMYWEWFVEATAEDMTVLKNNYSGSLTYPIAIEALKSIKNITVFLDDQDVETIDSLSCTTDLNKLFACFNASTEKDQREILNMMYSINLFTNTNYTSTTNDFYEYIREKKGYRPVGDEKEQIESSVKDSVLLTESKVLYKNLIIALKEKEYSLEDILHIISIYEDFANIYTYYGFEGYGENHLEYMDKYCKIQESFFETLSNQLSISKEEMQDLYNRYHIASHNRMQSVTEKKNNFYQQYEYELSFAKSQSINHIYNIINGVNKMVK